MVQTSLPLPVGADMIALAILVVAVRGSMVVDEEEAALGAMVGMFYGRASYFLWREIEMRSAKVDVANPFDYHTSFIPLIATNKCIEAYPIPVPYHPRPAPEGLFICS